MCKRARLKLLAAALAGCVAFTSLPAHLVQAAVNTVTNAEGKTTIKGLTTEYQTNPIGIEAEGIHFGWQMDSDVIGARQTAYQIEVFAEDGTLAWDSGKVDSDQSVGIACGGTLSERSIFRWEVTIWDQAGNAYTADASFETGVSSVQEWKDAEFIRMNASRLAPTFRTEKALAQTNVEKARLYITALGAYQAYVNGSRVGEWDEQGNLVYHHMNPGYGNADVSLGYQTYDVTPFLAGKDSVAVAVSAGTGWYNGMANNTNNSQPAVKALLMVDYADGNQQVIKTNTTDWKGTLAGGITTSGVYYGEDYNAFFARELGDYTQAGYDDSKWVNALTREEEKNAYPCIVNEFAEQTASYVRLKVDEVGPAVPGNGAENFLQIMELELLGEGQDNVVSQVAPDISNSMTWGNQWAAGNLTDGDLGAESDCGYTSNILGNVNTTSFTPGEPITITFHLGEEKSFRTLKMYPRTSQKAVSGNECVNYPKKYTLQISSDGQNWTDVDLNGEAEGAEHTVESLRNTVLFPEIEAIHYDTDFGRDVSAKHVRISVSQVGPAVYEVNDWEKENRMQIMELELWDGFENAAKNVVPVVSNNFELGEQWSAANLTDGDYGEESDHGYTTEILGYQQQVMNLDSPITIDFNFEETVTFSSLRIFPRTVLDSISYGVCANYPKMYTVSVSENGTDWTDIVTDEDKGMIRKETLLQNMEMSTTSFPGVIRAQAGLPGRMTGEFDQEPVSAYIYSGNKEGSEYVGGEVNKLAEYTGADMFEDGIMLPKGQTMIVNMGQNLTAVPDIRFSAPCGAKAVMRFAEMLNDGSEAGNGATQADGPKGSIYQKSLRGARSQATYVFSGEGVETYQPGMSFFGYQYVEITASDDVVIYGLTSKGISSVSEQLGRIITNNNDVNKFFNNVLFGQMSNYYTAPTDCNQRDERLSWTGDTQAFAQTAVYNFNSYAFLQDMQEIFNENTKKNGYVGSVTDSVNTSDFFGNWAAGWSDVLIIVPWVLYQQTGDISFLEDNWEYLDTYMTFLTNNERAVNQCWIPDNARNFGDWLSFQGTSIEVIYDYYYGYMNQIMAEIAGILGKWEKQAAYREKYEGIKETFLATHVTFYDGNLVVKSGEGNQNFQFMYREGKGGVWENNSQTSLLWMLKLGFYDSEEMKEAAIKLLVENIRNENPDSESIRAQAGKNTLSVGFLGSNVIAPVLTDIGNAAVSYDLLLQDGQPSWLFEVKAGATTVWERWNSYTPGVGFGDSEMNSFNHYAYGSVVEWMYRYMAGISADVGNPGFKHIILQPTLDTGTKYNEEERINSVDASYDSVYGRIESSWTSEGGKLATYRAKIPANTTATLYLPVEEVNAEKLPEIPGAAFVKMTEHNGQMAAEFSLQSGEYEFTASKGSLTPSENEPGGDKPGDNTGDNSGDNTGENPGEKPGDNTGDNGGDNTVENPGEKPGDNTGDNTGNKPGDNTGDNSGDNTGENPGEKPGDNTGDNTGNKPGDNTGDNPGDDEEEPTLKIPLADCQIGNISRQYYNGKKKTPTVAISYNGEKLTKGIDYTVTYEKNQNIGTAKATITGLGAYTGTISRTFLITVKKNASYTIGNYKYRITNAKTNGKGMVSLIGVKSSSVRKKLKKATVSTSVKIGGKEFKVTAIGNNAFKSCKKLTSVDIKANVTTIGSKAFYNCSKLKKLTIRGTKLKTVGKNALKKINAKAVVQVPKSKAKAYKIKFKRRGQNKTVTIKAVK